MTQLCLIDDGLLEQMLDVALDRLQLDVSHDGRAMRILDDPEAPSGPHKRLLDIIRQGEAALGRDLDLSGRPRWMRPFLSGQILVRETADA